MPSGRNLVRLEEKEKLRVKSELFRTTHPRISPRYLQFSAMGMDHRIVASHKVMGLKTHTGFPKELLKYLYLTCLLNEQGNVGPPVMEENFFGKVNESVSEAIRRITG